MSTHDHVGPPGPLSGVRTPVALIIGAVSGAVGAMLGGGTGAVTVPALDRFSTLRRALVHGTPTMSNTVVAAVGATVYGLRGGALDFPIGLPMMVGGVVGAVFGARVVARVSPRALRTGFLAVLVMAGVQLILHALDVDPLGTAGGLWPGTDSTSVLGVTAGVVVGLVVGSWSAALGMGGGLIAVPALVLLFGVSLHTAEGTSLLVMFPNSAAAAAAHIRQGTADVRLGLRIASGAACGAALGALLALALPAHGIALVFGVAVLLLAAREARRLLR